ncbi:unnamed protein product, partial [Timema podura]|nr:unnamed protein product [Timema podura]
MDSLKGLLQNKLLIYNIFAGVFYVMGEAGTMTFSMKYMEIQYHTSAAGASMISGSASVFAMIFGFLGSGYFIGRFKPRPRLVLGWNVILGAVHVIGSIIYIYLGCQDKGVYGLDPVTG